MRLVRATRFGVAPHGGGVEPGQTFEWDGPLGTWMEEVEPAPPPPFNEPAEAIVEAEPEQISEAAPEETAPSPARKRKGG